MVLRFKSDFSAWRWLEEWASTAMLIEHLAFQHRSPRVELGCRHPRNFNGEFNGGYLRETFGTG